MVLSTYLVLQRLLPGQWRRMEVEVHPPPPECLIPMLPLLLRQPPGQPGPGSGPGWMYQPGLWQKCMAAARWLRPLKSHPHCATGGEDETGWVRGIGTRRSADQSAKKWGCLRGCSHCVEFLKLASIVCVQRNYVILAPYLATFYIV